MLSLLPPMEISIMWCPWEFLIGFAYDPSEDTFFLYPIPFLTVSIRFL